MELEIKKWVTPDAAGPNEKYLIHALSGLEAQPYSAHVRAALHNGAAAVDIGIPEHIAEGMLLDSLRDWSGVLVNGAPVECTNDLKVRLPGYRLTWLISEITAISFMTPVIEKNLSSRPKSQRTRKALTAKPVNGKGTATKPTRPKIR